MKCLEGILLKHQKKRSSSVTENSHSTRPKKKQKVDESEFLQQLKGLTSEQLIKFRKSHDLTDIQERELKVHTRKIKKSRICDSIATKKKGASR